MGWTTEVGDNFTIVPATNADEAITAMQAQQTVVSRGPFVHATIDGRWAPGNTYSGTQELLLRGLCTGLGFFVRGRSVGKRSAHRDHPHREHRQRVAPVHHGSTGTESDAPLHHSGPRQ